MCMHSTTDENEERLKCLLKEGMEPRCTPLGAILALVSIGEFSKLHSILKSVLDKGLHPSDIHEILLQSHLFAGFPRAICGLQIFSDLLRERRIEPRDFLRKEKPRKIRSLSRGRNLFKRVYRGNAKRVLRSLHTLHPQYDRWVLADAYGRVLSRPFLSARVRELCAVAALTVTGVPRQLCSHIMGAVHLGARPSEVEGMIRNMEALAERKKIDQALEILKGLALLGPERSI